MLRRYREGELENLTPNTRDSEVLFIITACEFLLQIKNFENNKQYFIIYQAIQKAINYIESNILTNGLIHGADWRDVREDLDDKIVLTNACFLYRAYELIIELYEILHMDSKHFVYEKDNIMNTIHNNFWNGIYFNDYSTCKNFDIYGNSLVIL